MIELSLTQTLVIMVGLFLSGYVTRGLEVDLRRKRSNKRFAHLLQNDPEQKEDHP